MCPFPTDLTGATSAVFTKLRLWKWRYRRSVSPVAVGFPLISSFSTEGHAYIKSLIITKMTTKGFFGSFSFPKEKEIFHEREPNSQKDAAVCGLFFGRI